MRRPIASMTKRLFLALLPILTACGSDDGGSGSAAPRPNIVFVIMDDVGIDQVEAFGLGEGDLAATPNLTTIADNGVKFSNVWAMPECSPSRTTFFSGRYPLRTGVDSALVPSMLPQAQLSPYETGIARVLAAAGYQSALVGKYHLGNHSPSGNCSPQTLGWDFFEGNMEAGPPSIDQRGGHVEGGVAAATAVRSAQTRGGASGDSCIPDLPPDQGGCPLYTPGQQPPEGVDCTAVCAGYKECTRDESGLGELEVGYTCDATACTSMDAALVGDACDGLDNGEEACTLGLVAILDAETRAGCSCCASQLCNCQASGQTQQKVFSLNANQRAIGETPQCDINGTLCGGLVCGYDQSAAAGSCYFADGSCSDDTVEIPAPGGGRRPETVNGRSCIEAGGLFVRGSDCQPTTIDDPNKPVINVGDGPVVLDFSRQNGYYAWPNTTLEGTLPPNTTDFADPACGEPPLSREYMTIAQTDDAIAWYTRQSGPRMISVSYNSIHTPYQKAPQSLAEEPVDGNLACGQTLPDRLLGDNMFVGMDVEIGRLLSELGLADLDGNGNIVDATLVERLTEENTVLIIVGDNGTLGFSVKEPFDPSRAKGTVYQTGVWVPLIVAGPPSVVAGIGRTVAELVNVADLFILFSEIAGVDARSVVPPAHTLDGQPMLSYLTDPTPVPVRQYNFTQLGAGVFEQPQNNVTRSWPCVLNGTDCDDVLIDTQDLCETNAGVWWGATSIPDPSVVAVYAALGQPDKANTGTGSCCAVNQVLAMIDQPAVGILPVGQYAVRDKRYKLVQLTVPDCENATAEDLEKFPPAPTRELVEFYDLENTSPENPLGLDEQGFDLLCQPAAENDPPVQCPGGARVCATPTSCLLPAELQAYNALQDELSRILNSQSPCPPTGSADGNLDQRVDQLDAQGVQDFAGIGPSFFDFNQDAQTNELDAQIVAQNLGTDCLGGCRRSDLNVDGAVDDLDLTLLKAAFGACVVCGADLNGDGVVNGSDQEILEGLFGCTP